MARWTRDAGLVARLADASGYAHTGLRVDDARYGAGDVLPDSRAWVDGDPAGDTLDGTSAVRVPARDLRTIAPERGGRGYYGRFVYLLGSDGALPGEDDGEILMRRPVVLARWVAQ